MERGMESLSAWSGVGPQEGPFVGRQGSLVAMENSLPLFGPQFTHV